MPHVQPLSREELAEFEPFFAIIEQTMGFVPNSMLTLGRRPDLLRGFAALSGAVLGGGSVRPELKQLVAFVASCAAGCRYCQAHTAHGAERGGAEREKIEAAFQFDSDDNEKSELFSDAERAALRLARDAALVPNETGEQHFAELRKHFSDEEIVELVAVVSMFGWLNRWNDTMATELENGPQAFARQRRAPHGWSDDRHTA